MTNPYQQQHSSSGFGGAGAGDSSFSPSGLPTPINQHRSTSSYASVVSGAPAGAASLSGRPPRVSGGAFSHLLNPSPDSSSNDMHSSSNLYGSTRTSHLDMSALPHPYRNGTQGGGGEQQEGTYIPGFSSGSSWPPPTSTRLGLPWFSRAFDIYMNKKPVGIGGFGGGGVGGGIGEDGYSTAQTPQLGTILSPSYLKGSVYMQKLEEAHRAKFLAEREGHAAKSQTGSAGGLAGNIGNGHHHGFQMSKLPAGSHRGVAFELVEKPPASSLTEEDDSVSPLPSKWNKEDKDGALEVLGEGYEVKYTGRSSSDHEACAIRADHYMPPQCGVYYFEVLILNRKREDTTIGIGFSSRTVALQRAPGWEPESWGYHGDDGNCFAAQNVGKSYGPKFGPGDTIGCLVNFRLGHALFTKNGDELGIAFRDVNFKDVKGKLYPTVGLKKPGDHVWVNFGQLPFQFDIDGYMKKQQKMISDNIRNADTSKLAPPLNETELIQQLVLQFLQHDGYVETARAFAEEMHVEKLALNLDPGAEVEGINIKDDEDASNRQRIRRAILEGDIDRALKYTDAYYPNVLRDNEQVYFRLRCRKFIEMIRKEAELNLLLEDRGGKGGTRGARYDARGEVDDDEEMMDTTEDVDDSYEMTAAGVSKLSQEALAYGQELRVEFKDDLRKEVQKHLDEIFALIAYPNPLKEKDVAHLLDRAGRVAVAEELNSAILMSLGKSSRAALENLYAQTCVLLEDLRQDGGDGAFVTVQSVIDDVPKSFLL